MSRFCKVIYIYVIHDVGYLKFKVIGSNRIHSLRDLESSTLGGKDICFKEVLKLITLFL